MDKICRICLVQKPKMFDIYETEDTNSTLSLFEKIIQCTNVAIARNNNWPDKVCPECRNELEISYRFRMNVESADIALRNYDNGLVIDGFIPEVQKQELVEELEDDHDRMETTEIYIEEEDNVVDLMPTFVEQTPLKMENITVSKSRSFQQPKLEPDKKTIIKTEGLQTVMTIPKISKAERPPIVKGILTRTDEDGSIKTMVRLARVPTMKKSPTIINDEKIGQFVCDKCGKEFKKASAIRAHAKRHNEVKPNVCSICSKSFTLPVELKRYE